VSPTVERTRTDRALRLARATHGDAHPATWAAFGRAVIAWGDPRNVSGREALRRAYDGLDDEERARISSAHTTAQLRLIGVPGAANRSARRRRN